MPKRQTSPITLFSFQDILTSLMGVVFLIVLLLSLRLVHQIPSVSGLSREEAVKLNQEIQTMEIEIQVLEKQLEHWRQKAAQFLASPLKLQDDQRQLSQQREYLLTQLLAEKKHLEELIHQSETLERELQRFAELRKKRLEEIDQLQNQLAEKKTTVNFHFHPASGGKKPWLVDLGAAAWQVISPETFQTIQTFPQTPQSKRISLFLQWARTRDPRREYFVLFVRPGALEAYDDLRSRLENAGFELGIDLLGENQKLGFTKGQGL